MNLLKMSYFYRQPLCKKMSLNFSKTTPKSPFAPERTRGRTLEGKTLSPERGFVWGSEPPVGSRPPCALARPGFPGPTPRDCPASSPDTGLPLFTGENVERPPAWPGAAPHTLSGRPGSRRHHSTWAAVRPPGHWGLCSALFAGLGAHGHRGALQVPGACVLPGTRAERCCPVPGHPPPVGGTWGTEAAPTSWLTSAGRPRESPGENVRDEGGETRLLRLLGPGTPAGAARGPARPAAVAGDTLLRTEGPRQP